MAEKSLVRQYSRAALRIIQGVIEVVVHWLFGFVYGGPGESMPPIRNLILLDSASTIALKIRTGKVSLLLTQIGIFSVVFFAEDNCFDCLEITIFFY